MNIAAKHQVLTTELCANIIGKQFKEDGLLHSLHTTFFLNTQKTLQKTNQQK
jgi:hypothetical protein